MAGKDRSTKDKMMASELKKRGIDRTTGKCAVCYAPVTVDSNKGTRFNHKCKIGGMK